MRSNNIILAIVAVEGLLVLGIELVSSVLLTPYWGNSFVFWVINLFLAMLGLSIAYFIAHRIEKNNNYDYQLLITKSLFFVYIYTQLIYNFNVLIQKIIISLIDSTLLGILFSVSLFTFIPLTFLGVIPIFAVKINLHNDDLDEGKLSGKYFSISSLFGIISVLVIALAILPIGGSSVVILFLNLVMIGILIYLKYSKFTKYSSWLFIIPIMTFLFLNFIEIKKNKKISINKLGGKVLMKKSGILGELEVYENYYSQTKYLFVNNVAQTKSHTTGRSLYPYLYSLSTYSSYKPVGSKILLAGFGGGNLVYELVNLGYDVDVVDIDKRLLPIAKQYFLLPDNKFNFIHSDIRRYIKLTDTKYDVVIFDLSFGESVPANVYTLECFKETEKLLNKDGLVLIHFLSSLNDSGKKALFALKNTLNKAGLENEIMNRLNKTNIMDGVEDINKPDAFIFAAARNLDFSNVKFRPDIDLLPELVPQKNNMFLKLNNEGNANIILTDDKPYLDILQLSNVLKLRKENIADIVIRKQND
jgi:2-polyprenyl-3-methyl-5-hydroxy-6-metoxy-1,4-benzoquinol methylase